MADKLEEDVGRPFGQPALVGSADRSPQAVSAHSGDGQAQGRATLLPCPFCGAKPAFGLGKKQFCQLHGEPFQDFSIWCRAGHAKVTASNEERAFALWNTRAPVGADQ